ncbi:hypothetical protein [Deinococcus cellulosilyticus]|uniref:Uncharacterized protein n=1 Tax=Deinococcus cellulosilyticus (strain DSM 18568 / NBRC 106333 / KACC 11606 / 5516J-15) TaxID=1223518 RepID=A0A511N633_DEIC1|nr:hypothetical protein [Deinococcus cellulosilyticus]GEM48315.1 hypothetical protein DC3_39500 [Deinococcus cellulosilyticus NBRC 106333 = KACC 11606]
MMILHVFGETHTANVIRDGVQTLLLAHPRTLELLQDACEIEEPVWVNSTLCRVKSVQEPELISLDRLLEVEFEVLDGLH